MRIQPSSQPVSLPRRQLLRRAGGIGTAGVLSACSSVPTVPAALTQLCTTQLPNTPKTLAAGNTIDSLCLMPGLAKADLTGGAAAPTEVWAFNGSIPGPMLRVRQNANTRFELANRLPDATTIHWHGIRLKNAMDGVPGLTQAAVKPNETFTYNIQFPDAGTYWYHPHLGTPEQVGRGLSGPIIVEESEPPAIDQEWVWMLDDWRLTREGQIQSNFYAAHDVAHAGRIGNTVTINGEIPRSITVTQGNRVRVRMINAANARIFALQFEHHQPWVIALDGNPLEKPHQLGDKERLFIAPGQRVDLIIDMHGDKDWRIIDRFNQRRAYEVVALKYSGLGSGLRKPRGAPVALAPNPHSKPDADNNRSEAIQLGGGAGRNPVNPPTETTAERAARIADRLAGKPATRPVWSVNGFAHTMHGADHPFEFEAYLGQTIYLTFENRTNWWHPMHLHGHSFRELMRNGKPVPGQPWRDTSLLAPRTNLTVAFVADNPGDWLIHCHVLEHHAGGMGTQFRVHA